VLLEFNATIWFRAKKRLIEGRLPKTKQKQKQKLQSDEEGRSKTREWARDNDCSIIESLSQYFGGKKTGKSRDKQLFLCTENLDDFGFEKPGTKRKVLDKRLQANLPPTEIFLDLESLVKALEQRTLVETPPTDEEFEQVLKEKVEEEERIARETSWMTPGIPPSTQILGQELRRLHERYTAEWRTAAGEGDISRGDILQKTIYGALVGLINKYKNRLDIPHDVRWKQLVELRDQFEEILRIRLEPDEYWKEGTNMLFEMGNLAHAYESY
jgi:hypothetical protein